MVKKKVKKVSKKNFRNTKQSDSKLFAFLAVLLSIVGFIIAIVLKRNDKYIMFYAKQSLVLFIAWLVSGAIMMIPFLGWIAGPIIYILTLILWVMTWINALSGKKKDTWIIGEFADKIDL
jgi:uncharacterized membrane protein